MREVGLRFPQYADPNTNLKLMVTLELRGNNDPWKEFNNNNKKKFVLYKKIFLIISIS